MNHAKLITCALAAFILLPAAMTARAADENPAKDAKSQRQELREKLKNMTPEERQAALKKWREEHPEATTPREQLRKQSAEGNKLTAEQREARRKEMHAALEKRLAELKKKQTDGTLTDLEKKRLERLELALKRADQTRREIPPADKPDTAKAPAQK
jgi:hypothetical protein